MTNQEKQQLSRDVAQQQSEPVAEHSKYISHLWEMIGRWSAYLASNCDDANLAPPDYLIDAIKNATQPPNTVSLEEFNKLLDALRDQVGAKDRAGWLGEIDDILYSMLDDEQYAKVSREISRAKADGLQAIEEANEK